MDKNLWSPDYEARIYINRPPRRQQFDQPKRKTYNQRYKYTEKARNGQKNRFNHR